MDASQKKFFSLHDTPLTNKLLSAKKRNLNSFHALPLNRAMSVKFTNLWSKYKDLYGEEYLSSDVSYSGNLLDNPVSPFNVLKDSEEITAKAFGSMVSHYISTGTTISNFITVFGVSGNKGKVLVDKNSHQSIHFALNLNRNRTVYTKNKASYQHSGRSITDIEYLITQYKEAYDNGDPFDMVILNGCSYEGVMYDLSKILEECIAINDDCIFFIDEAWLAYGYFHDYYENFCAMKVAKKLSLKYPQKKINVVSTHSAHKTLSSLRQGSYIHVYSNDSEVFEKINSTKYMFHTTSPSYPILCSLELARAQMAYEGKLLIERALMLGTKLKDSLKKMKKCRINEDSEGPYYILDPLKISINFEDTGISIEKIKEILMEDGIYVNRYTHTSILFNLHIGIGNKEIETLLDSLTAMDKCNFYNFKQNNSSSENESTNNDEIVDYFLISYPPGVPLLVPGDKLDNSVSNEITSKLESGASLIKTKAN